MAFGTTTIRSTSSTSGGGTPSRTGTSTTTTTEGPFPPSTTHHTEASPSQSASASQMMMMQQQSTAAAQQQGSSHPSSSTTHPELAVFVQDLLDQMQNRFLELGDSITGKMDDMGRRMDELESSTFLSLVGLVCFVFKWWCSVFCFPFLFR